MRELFNNAKQAKKGEERFVCSYVQGSNLSHVTQIWVDKETGINYLFHYSGNAAGLTPLLNPDGTPVVTPISRWEEE